MAEINISGGQVNIASGNSEINAIQANSGSKCISCQSQVNMICGNGKVNTVQINRNGQQYNSTTYKSNE